MSDMALLQHTHRGVTFHSLLVIRYKITRYSLQKLLVAKNINRYLLQILLFNRCRSCLLQNITRYLLQILLVVRCESCSLQKNHSLLVAEVDRCKKLLVICCKIRSLLVAEVAPCKIYLLLVGDVAPCKKLLVTRYKENQETKSGQFYLFLQKKEEKGRERSLIQKICIAKI